MELFGNLAIGFQVALTFQNLLYAFFGVLLGIIRLAGYWIDQRRQQLDRRDLPHQPNRQQGHGQQAGKVTPTIFAASQSHATTHNGSR